MNTHTLMLRTDNDEIRVSLQSCGARVGEKAVSAAAVASLTRRVETLLNRKKGQPPPTTRELSVFGEDLAVALLGTELLTALTDVRGGECLWIQADDPHLLNLPFELLPRPGGNFLIEDGHLLLRRAADAGAPGRVADPVLSLRPGPLRVLFMACSPQDESRLSFEKEEAAMVKLCLQAGRGVHLEVAESGTFVELQEKVADYRPHIVHLSGHASHEEKDDTGYFAFEDERGHEDARSARAIVSGIFENARETVSGISSLRGSGVAMVFLSACGTARSGAAGLCQSLAASGQVPLVLGWGLSVLDDPATRFGASLFTSLAGGESVSTAIDKARAGLLKDCRYKDEHGVERMDTDFILPRLFAAGEIDTLFNSGHPPDPPPHPSFRYQRLGDRIAGRAKNFVGRRRLLQTTRLPLRDADGGRRILLFTGIGGAGKSTLSTRLANYFLAEREPWPIVALKPRLGESDENFAERLLKELLERLAPERPHTAALRNGGQDLPGRLVLAIDALNENRILLILDNLESLMPPPPAPPEWRSELFAGFFNDLVNRLTGGSRVILTSRYVPAGLDPATAALVLHQPIPDFTEADFLKRLEYDERIGNRLRAARIPPDLMAKFYHRLGATPGFVEKALPMLATLSAEAIEKDLDSIGAEPTAQAGKSNGRLSLLQQQYFADLFLPKLYRGLSEPPPSAASPSAPCPCPTTESPP